MQTLSTLIKTKVKVGDTVIWLQSSYIIIEITDNNALLKQNFSIGTTLTEMVDLDDLSLINKKND